MLTIPIYLNITENYNNNMSTLEKLHVSLAEAYTTILEKGTDDPRMLKEVREFLRDNDITEDTIAMNGIGGADANVVEFPDFEVSNG